MTRGSISVERVGSHVDLLLIDRPPVNALPPDDWRAIGDLIRTSGDDGDVRVLVIAGTRDAFCAGADIRHLSKQAVADDGSTALGVVAATADAIRSLRVPVVAAISGSAHGGGLELALACDLRLADDSATFAAAGVNMGLIASVGSLIDAIGAGRARSMLLTGRRIDAATASSWGLVTEMLSERVLDDALEVATDIARLPPLSVEATKLAASAYGRIDHAAHQQMMGELFTELAASADHAEALAAFLEKRPGTYRRG